MRGVTVALGLGSNLPAPDEPPFSASASRDGRQRALEGALQLLEESDALEIVATSSLVESEPCAVPDAQPPYLNACALVSWRGELEGLHRLARAVERAAGREGKGDRAARALDVDLLAAWRSGAGDEPLRLEGDEPLRLEGDELTVPHPALEERGFVLVPLAEIAACRMLRRGTAGAPLRVRDALVALDPREREPPAVRRGPSSAAFPRAMDGPGRS